MGFGRWGNNIPSKIVTFQKPCLKGSVQKTSASEFVAEARAHGKYWRGIVALAQNRVRL